MCVKLVIWAMIVRGGGWGREEGGGGGGPQYLLSIEQNLAATISQHNIDSQAKVIKTCLESFSVIFVVM